MRIFSKGTLTEFCRSYPDAETSLFAWEKVTKLADWQGPADIKNSWRASDIIGTKGDTGLRSGDVRVIFDIKGNSYRLVTHINFELKVVF